MRSLATSPLPNFRAVTLTPTLPQEINANSEEACMRKLEGKIALITGGTAVSGSRPQGSL
jgi:hypothetical protein